MTLTATETATPTRSDTPAPTGTAGATATASPSATPVPPTPTAPPSASASATPAQGPLVILGIAPVPNPNPDSLVLDMAGPGDRVEANIYTRSLVLARHFDAPENLSPGWKLVPLDGLLGGLPSGLYFVQVTAWRGAIPSVPKITKVYLLR